MKKEGTEDTRRTLAQALNYDYSEFLRLGQAVIDGKDPALAEEEEFKGLTADTLRERGFLSVPFSDNMRLAAGSGGTIPIDEDAGTSPVVVYGPALGRTSAKNLQAFRVGGDSMEPLISEGGIVVADISERDPRRLKDGKIYVLCWELLEGECAVKFVRWGEKGKSVVISSPSNELYPPIVRLVEDVSLIGRVIWAWREFK